MRRAHLLSLRTVGSRETVGHARCCVPNPAPFPTTDGTLDASYSRHDDSMIVVLHSTVLSGAMARMVAEEALPPSGSMASA